MIEDKKTSTLYGIELFRAVAAILVVIYHISRHLNQSNGYFPLGSFTEFGHAGVDFFFVLSGFIILFVHYHDVGKPKSIGNYLKKRFTRIYPFYWVVCLITLSMIPFVQSATFPGWEGTIKSLFLMPQSGDLLIGVSWTLQHEVLFYLIFSLVILHLRIGLVVVSVWLAAIIGVNYFWPLKNIPSVFFSAFNLQFFMGMMAAFLIKKCSLGHPRTIFWLGIAVFVGTAVMEVHGGLDGFGRDARICYGFGAMLIVIGTVLYEINHGLKIPQIGRVLGRSSYSIYLTHLIFNGIAYKMLDIAGVNQMLPSWSIAFILILVSITGGCLLSVYVEVPMTNWVRSSFRNKH